MIYLKTPEEIEKMRAACALVSRTLGELAKWVTPGVTTNKIDSIAVFGPHVLVMAGFPVPCAVK